MILIGNNTITLTPAALMQIVSKHLNASQRYGDEKDPIRVTQVRARAEGMLTSFDFEITTDPAPGEGGQSA